MPDIFGYFDDHAQTIPAFDPGLGVPCPICLRSNQLLPVKTISLMRIGDDRSYFFRAHATCWENTSDSDKAEIESSLIDGHGQSQ